jgi:hypothetical protein
MEAETNHPNPFQPLPILCAHANEIWWAGDCSSRKHKPASGCSTNLRNHPRSSNLRNVKSSQHPGRRLRSTKLSGCAKLNGPIRPACRKNCRILIRMARSRNSRNIINKEAYPE